jgi:signal transduction histidine kinase
MGGIGITKEHLPKLFTKFYRVKDDKTKNITGTGLGLVITKKIAEQHGGNISVESEFGVGTTFVITLPLSKK